MPGANPVSKGIGLGHAAIRVIEAIGIGAVNPPIQFVNEIYVLTKAFPKEELFGLTSQLRRASLSVSLNLAEGAARNSKKDFIKFISYSEGSCSEIDTLLEICMTLKLIPDQKIEYYHQLNESVSALLYGLKISLGKQINDKTIKK